MLNVREPGHVLSQDGVQVLVNAFKNQSLFKLNWMMLYNFLKLKINIKKYTIFILWITKYHHPS